MIKFSKYNLLYLLISVTVIGVGLFSIVRWGYNVSIDFTGGATVVYSVSPSRAKFSLTTAQLSKYSADKKFQITSVKREGDVLRISLRNFAESAEPDFRKFLSDTDKLKLTIQSFDSVGPVIGAAAIRKTLFAVGLGVLVILGYIFYSFKKFTFAFAAVVALLHDVLVVLGTYSLISHFWGAQLDTLFVTALLTTMSFSVHDTIVIFDNIRHELARHGTQNIASLADSAVSSTLVRSINNSVTIIFMLLALVLLGGESIHYFAIALLIGTVTGVYSSPFVATPVMVMLERKFGKK